MGYWFSAALLLLATSSVAFAQEPAGISLDMPPGMPALPSANPCRRVTVFLDQKGAIFVDERPVARAQLGKTVADSIKAPNVCKRVMIRPDEDASYADVVMTISLLKQAGIRLITLVDTSTE